jgi:hypothetical protein
MNAHQSLAVAEPIPAFAPIAPELAEAEAMVGFEQVAKSYAAIATSRASRRCKTSTLPSRADRSPA